MRTRCRDGLAAFLLIAVGSPAALATFHFMQIEMVIGGVNGDPSAQAIQLRMRSAFQGEVGPPNNVRLVARDAAGLNPVTIINFPSDVTNQAAGSRILIASPNFSNYTSPAAVPDFTMTNLIPPSYLAAGTLTFENTSGAITTIWWRVSWGGAGYTGSHSVATTNDPNGSTSPAFPTALPSTTLQALQFRFAAGTVSTTSANDYQVTAGAAVFTDNGNQSYTVTAPPPCVPCDTDCNGTVNPFDIQPFLDLLTGSGTPCAPCSGDTNGNGTINPFDINDFIACLA